jgi:hypothetical protein
MLIIIILFYNSPGGAIALSDGSQGDIFITPPAELIVENSSRYNV